MSDEQPPWKENISILSKEEKGRSWSNQMILIHSNVNKFFKKQHINTFYCFVNRFIGRLLPLTTIERKSKEWVSINREYIFKSYKWVFNCLMKV